MSENVCPYHTCYVFFACERVFVWMYVYVCAICLYCIGLRNILNVLHCQEQPEDLLFVRWKCGIDIYAITETLIYIIPEYECRSQPKSATQFSAQHCSPDQRCEKSEESEKKKQHRRLSAQQRFKISRNTHNTLHSSRLNAFNPI